MEALAVHTIPTPLGDVYAAFSEHGLCYLGFYDQEKNPLREFLLKNELRQNDAPSPLIDKTRKDLAEYFAGKLTTPSTTFDLRGTDFQKTVWRSLSEIPFGQRRTYKEQTNLLGDPLAIRAVASANGKNPISILIPCHRVVGADGSLTGYAGGIGRKKKLLDLEAKMSGKGVQMGLW